MNMMLKLLTREKVIKQNPLISNKGDLFDILVKSSVSCFQIGSEIDVLKVEEPVISENMTIDNKKENEKINIIKEILQSEKKFLNDIQEIIEVKKKFSEKLTEKN